MSVDSSPATLILPKLKLQWAYTNISCVTEI